ncbi:MAG TPA: TetR/AcrR family transcriptional regulator [Blastocatellia bacterium]|nr:TetR/AcrR family transcriptional regulator [Blastocatellia bacterium]
MTTVPHDTADSLGVSRMSGDARREQLIQVAMNLFSRKGFSGTTTKEIAQAAGVTEALIFRHFPTKDALYEAILRWRVEQSNNQNWLASLTTIAEQRDDEALIRAIASGLLEFHRENIDFLRLMFFAVLENHQLAQSFRERQIKPVYDFLCGYVSTRQAEGAFVGVDPGAAVRAIFGMPFYHSVVTNLFHCSLMQVTETEAIDTFVQIALNGLRSGARLTDTKPGPQEAAGETE